MPRVRTLDDIGDESLRGERVFLRADLNVPLSARGRVADHTRIAATLPTIAELRARGARTVLASHLGRPGGRRVPRLSLAPVAVILSERLGTPVRLIGGEPGEELTRRAVDSIATGGVALLENTRYHPGETSNDAGLAQAFGSLADAFVADAFGVAHRAHASNVGAALAIRDRGGPVVAGRLMARELHFLSEALREPRRPFVALMGGAKISGKLGLIRAILSRVDRLLVGGAMANTFLCALGFEVGQSLVEESLVPDAAAILDEAGDKLLLPVDLTLAAELGAAAEPVRADRAGVGAGMRIADIGPRTGELYARELASARTVVWNGPMGVFELAPFAAGTARVAEALAEAADSGAVVVLGGGDSASAAAALGVGGRMTHISTGGGASLDLLAGRELPGVSVLEEGGRGG